MKFIFSGVNYSSRRGQFLLDSVDTHDRLIVQFSDSPVSLRRMKARFCSGWYDLSCLTSYPCPTSSPLDNQGNSCEDCLNKTGFIPFFHTIPFVKLSPQQQLYNSSPHSVYLASFGPDLIKVGISSSARLHERWLDQGALYAREIFNCCDAATARNREAFVSSHTSTTEQISTILKARSMVRYGISYNPEPAFDRVIKLLSDCISLSDKANLTVDLNTHYRPERIPFSKLIDISKESPLEISGSVFSTIGSICIFENNGCYYLCDTNKFKSHIIHFDRTIRPRQKLGLF